MFGGAISPDYYISANQTWMKKVVKKGYVEQASVMTPWGNQLAVATSSNSDGLEVRSITDLRDDAVRMIMIGDPSTAPFGRYAKQALKSMKVWKDVRGKIVTRRHVSLLASDLGQESSGTVGILYATNIKRPLQKLFEISEEHHSPIRYYIAPIKGTKQQLAAAFSQFVKSPEAITIAEENGFIVIP